MQVWHGKKSRLCPICNKLCVVPCSYYTWASRGCSIIASDNPNHICTGEGDSPAVFSFHCSNISSSNAPSPNSIRTVGVLSHLRNETIIIIYIWKIYFFFPRFLQGVFYFITRSLKMNRVVRWLRTRGGCKSVSEFSEMSRRYHRWLGVEPKTCAYAKFFTRWKKI